MREALISFVIAVCLGSMINSFVQTPDGDTQEAQPSGPTACVKGSDSNFQAEVLDSKEPVLVDFWAPWCGPCRKMGPVVEQIAQQNGGKLKVVKLNVDDNRATAETYKIQALPSFYIFKNGKIVEHLLGAAPKAELLAALERAGADAAKDVSSN